MTALATTTALPALSAAVYNASSSPAVYNASSSPPTAIPSKGPPTDWLAVRGNAPGPLRAPTGLT